MIHLGYFATNLWYQLSIKHGKTFFSIGNSISRWILLADINNKSRKFRSLYKIIKGFKMLRSFEVFMARLSLQKRGTSFHHHRQQRQHRPSGHQFLQDPEAQWSIGAHPSREPGVLRQPEVFFWFVSAGEFSVRYGGFLKWGYPH